MGGIMAYTIHLLFFCYTIFLFGRIALSWCPMEWQRQQWARFLIFYTDPYLNFFRRIIPPIGGVLDLSPILGLFVLRFLERIVLGLMR